MSRGFEPFPSQNLAEAGFGGRVWQQREPIAGIDRISSTSDPRYPYDPITMSAYHIAALSLIMLCASAAQGQGEAPSRWSLHAQAGAGGGYRNLSATGSSATIDAIMDGRNDREEYRIALGGHLGLGFQLTRRISLDAAVEYHQVGWKEHFDLSQLTFGDMIDPRRGLIYQTNDVAIPQRSTTQTIFHYLGLRLGAGLTLGEGRWRSITSIGVMPAWLFAARKRTHAEYVDGREDVVSRPPAEKFNAFNLFPYLGTGVAYNPGGRWEWRLQPTVRYGTSRIIDAPISASLFSGTVELGVRFTL